MTRNILFAITFIFSQNLFAQADLTTDTLINQDTVYERFNIWKLPSFPGGESGLKKFFATHLEYPFWKRLFCVDGDVSVIFTISRKCYPSEIQVERGNDRSFNTVILQTVKKMPRFNPPEMGANPPLYLFRCSVIFKKNVFKKPVFIYNLHAIAVKVNIDWEYIN